MHFTFGSVSVQKQSLEASAFLRSQPAPTSLTASYHLASKRVQDRSSKHTWDFMHLRSSEKHPSATAHTGLCLQSSHLASKQPGGCNHEVHPQKPLPSPHAHTAEEHAVTAHTAQYASSTSPLCSMHEMRSCTAPLTLAVSCLSRHARRPLDQQAQLAIECHK